MPSNSDVSPFKLDFSKGPEAAFRIPPKIRENLFKPFFTTKSTGEGTGLGLSIAHDIIVKQHGGKIDVETEPGAFSEFIVVLPRRATLTPPRKEVAL
jgi:nitrogen-specific signal transduction histidine kinase